MRDVAVVSFAQHMGRREDTRNEVEILLPVVREALKPTEVSNVYTVEQKYWESLWHQPKLPPLSHQQGNTIYISR